MFSSFDQKFVDRALDPVLRREAIRRYRFSRNLFQCGAGLMTFIVTLLVQHQQSHPGPLIALALSAATLWVAFLNVNGLLMQLLILERQQSGTPSATPQETP